jgi:hypothetical protein
MARPHFLNPNKQAAPAVAPAAAAPAMPPDWAARAVALGLALELRAAATTLQDSLAQAAIFERYITAGEQPAPPAQAPEPDDTTEDMGGGGA